MGLINNMKNKLFKKSITSTINDIEEFGEPIDEFEVLINKIDTFALFFKNREKKYVLFKDKNFPFMLIEPDIEFININKDNFEYYKEFYTFEGMTDELLKIERQALIDNKTEEEYLMEYLERYSCDYSKIVEKMKSFAIDKEQFFDTIKSNIQNTIEKYNEKCESSNPNLQSKRTYNEIMNSLMSINEFFKKYSYKYYKEFYSDENSVSHCGYPDYMWESGAERNIYTFI